MQQFRIEKNEAGQRLNKFLQKYLKEAPPAFLYKMLRKKNITLNEKKAEGREVLQEGDRIQFFFSEETFHKFRGRQENKIQKKTAIGRTHSLLAYEDAYLRLQGIEIVYEDQNILLLNKPAGILSQKAGNADLSLNEWLIGYLLHKGELTPTQLETFKPSVCNRLDRNTSGLVICGKSLPGSQKMSELLRTRNVHKYYRTFVKGRIHEEAYIEGYLLKDRAGNRVSLTSSPAAQKKGYERVETRYIPLTCYKGITYLEVELITGKTHQIRAHLSHLGHPILGDAKYGDRRFNQSVSGFIPQWQLLHAYRLELPPLTAPFEELDKRSFTAPEPSYFQQLKDLLCSVQQK